MRMREQKERERERYISELWWHIKAHQTIFCRKFFFKTKSFKILLFSMEGYTLKMNVMKYPFFYLEKNHLLFKKKNGK